ncbi:MAG: hypothetical protein Q9209_002489 [Squamulea sp. 1 TL-2023]
MGTTRSGRPPIFALIVCAKRHYTRFYKPIPNKPYNFKNTPEGTYVDTGVTVSYHWDFYLQSHSAIKGTARPAHYVVLHDEIIQEAAKEKNPPVNPANLLAQITHNMWYLLGRTTDSVSICPAAYYADLACGRARHYLKDVYDGKEKPPAGAEHDDDILRSWQNGLQRSLDVRLCDMGYHVARLYFLPSAYKASPTA